MVIHFINLQNWILYWIVLLEFNFKKCLPDWKAFFKVYNSISVREYSEALKAASTFWNNVVPADRQI